MLILLFSVFSLNNMEELLIVERFAFQNLPDMVKLELNSNPQLSYIHPQAFRWLSVCPTSIEEFCVVLEQIKNTSFPLVSLLPPQIPAIPTDSLPPQQPTQLPLWSDLLLPPLPGGGVFALEPSAMWLLLLLGTPPWQPVTFKDPGVHHHPLFLSPSTGGPRAAGGGGSSMGGHHWWR